VSIWQQIRIEPHETIFNIRGKLKKIAYVYSQSSRYGQSINKLKPILCISFTSINMGLHIKHGFMIHVLQLKINEKNGHLQTI
jgi:hypothetical protein